MRQIRGVVHVKSAENSSGIRLSLLTRQYIDKRLGIVKYNDWLIEACSCSKVQRRRDINLCWRYVNKNSLFNNVTSRQRKCGCDWYIKGCIFVLNEFRGKTVDTSSTSLMKVAGVKIGLLARSQETLMIICVRSSQWKLSTTNREPRLWDRVRVE